MMTCLKMLVAAAAVATIYGCASKPEWSIEEPSEPLNTYVKERCYMPDHTPKVRSGAGYVDAGTEFYFQYECSKYQAPQETVEISAETAGENAATTEVEKKAESTPSEESETQNENATG